MSVSKRNGELTVVCYSHHWKMEKTKHTAVKETKKKMEVMQSLSPVEQL